MRTKTALFFLTIFIPFDFWAWYKLQTWQYVEYGIGALIVAQLTMILLVFMLIGLGEIKEITRNPNEYKSTLKEKL